MNDRYDVVVVRVVPGEVRGTYVNREEVVLPNRSHGEAKIAKDVIERMGYANVREVYVRDRR